VNLRRLAGHPCAAYRAFALTERACDSAAPDIRRQRSRPRADGIPP
jgi:hypothetical protein